MSVGVPTRGTPTDAMVTIGDVIGACKSITTNKYIDGVKHSNWPAFDQKIWQRNFYEQIILNIASLHQIREYIAQNPQTWKTDALYIS